MTARKLGRGLDSLIEETKARGSAEPEGIDCAAIVPNPYQPRTRIEEEAVAELAESIREAQGAPRDQEVAPAGDPEVDVALDAGAALLDLPGRAFARKCVPGLRCAGLLDVRRRTRRVKSHEKSNEPEPA